MGFTPNNLLRNQEHAIKEYHVDWGTTTDQINASHIPLVDSGDRFLATTVETGLGEIENRVTTLELNVGTTTADVSVLENRVTTTELRLDLVENRVTTVESRLDLVENRATTIETRLDLVENRTTTTESRLDDAETRLDLVESRVTTTETRLDLVESRVTTTETRLTLVESRATTLEADVLELQTRATTDELLISALDARVTTNEVNITELQARATTIELNLAATTADLIVLEDSITSRINAYNSVRIVDSPTISWTHTSTDHLADIIDDSILLDHLSSNIDASAKGFNAQYVNGRSVNDGGTTTSDLWTGSYINSWALPLTGGTLSGNLFLGSYGIGYATTVALVFDASNNAIFSQGVSVLGDLFVSGTTFTTSAETVEIKDNLLVINKGEVGPGVTNTTAGIQVDRGSATDYLFVFDENTDNFRVGIEGNTQPVATREDSPVSAGVPYWDAVNYRFNTSSITIASNNLTIPASQYLYFIDSNVYMISSTQGIFTTRVSDLYTISAGRMLLNNNMSLYIRNAANDANLEVIKLDTSNIFQLGAGVSSIQLNKNTLLPVTKLLQFGTTSNYIGATTDNVVSIHGQTLVNLDVLGRTILTCNNSGVQITSTSYLEMYHSPIYMSNGESIYWTNVAEDTDYAALSVDADLVLQVGADTTSIQLNSPTYLPVDVDLCFGDATCVIDSPVAGTLTIAALTAIELTGPVVLAQNEVGIGALNAAGDTVLEIVRVDSTDTLNLGLDVNAIVLHQSTTFNQGLITTVIDAPTGSDLALTTPASYYITLDTEGIVLNNNKSLFGKTTTDLVTNLAYIRNDNVIVIGDIESSPLPLHLMGSTFYFAKNNVGFYGLTTTSAWYPLFILRSDNVEQFGSTELDLDLQWKDNLYFARNNKPVRFLNGAGDTWLECLKISTGNDFLIGTNANKINLVTNTECTGDLTVLNSATLNLNDVTNTKQLQIYQSGNDGYIDEDVGDLQLVAPTGKGVILNVQYTPVLSAYATYINPAVQIIMPNNVAYAAQTTTSLTKSILYISGTNIINIGDDALATKINGTSITITSTADTDSTYTGIVVNESGVLKYRTKAEILSDIAALPTASFTSQQSSAPSTPSTGDVYWDTDDEAWYRWNGTAWIQISGGGVGAINDSITDGNTTTAPSENAVKDYVDARVGSTRAVYFIRGYSVYEANNVAGLRGSTGDVIYYFLAVNASVDVTKDLVLYAQTQWGGGSQTTDVTMKKNIGHNAYAAANNFTNIQNNQDWVVAGYASSDGRMNKTLIYTIPANTLSTDTLLTLLLDRASTAGQLLNIYTVWGEQSA